MNTKKLTSLLAAATFALQAYGDEPDNLAPFNVIGTKADVSNLKGSGYVLDESDLGPFMHTDINDILRQVPGVYLRPEEGYGFFPNISLRGVDPKRSNKITIMEDGIPSSPAPLADPAGYYSPTAGRMSGFEVLKGGSSLKHGPNTTGGVLNYLSTPIPEEQMSRFRGSFGDNNERVIHAYSGGKLDFAGGKLGYLLEVFDHSSDGYKTIAGLNGAPEKNAPIARADMLLKLSYEQDGHYLEFKGGRMDMDADVSYQGVSAADFAANPYQRYAGTEHDNMDAEQTRYYLRYSNDLTDNVSLSATIFHNEFTRNWYKGSKVKADGDADYTSVGKGVYSNAALVGVLKGDTNGTYKVKSNNRAYEAQGIMANFDVEIGNNDLDLGFRFMTNDYDQLAYHEDEYEVNVAADGTTSTDKTYIAKSGNSSYKDADSFEVYLTDNIDLGALSLSPGVRHTSIDYQYKGGNDRTLDETIFGIGAAYEVSDSLNLFAGVYQGHTFPDSEAASTYIDYGDDDAPGGTGNDADTIEGYRNPETSVNFELGARGSFGKVGYDITYFNTSLEDMLFLASAAAGIDNAFNAGEGSINGLEIAVGSDFGNESVGIPVTLTATFTDTEFDTDGTFAYSGGNTNTKGNEFPYIPDTMFNLRTGLEFEKVSTYLNYYHQSDFFSDAANSNTIDSYGLLNWSGFFNLTESATVFAKVTNLTDEVFEHAIAPDGYRPGAPRIWSLGMEFDF